jgi:hypothetical protein
LKRRTQLPIYYSSTKRMENFIAQPQGAATFRPGTVYVGDSIQTDGNPSKLVPFKVNDSQAYMIEMSDGYLRVFNRSGLITATPLTITNAVAAVINPAKPSNWRVTLTVGSGHGITTNMYVLVAGLTASNPINGLQRITAITTTTIAYTITYGNTTISSFAGATAQKQIMITTPYPNNDFRQVQVAQANDVMYFVHPNHPPRKLTRTSETDWTFDVVTFTSDPFGVNDYPGTVCFHDQRLFYGGTITNPQTLWGSVVANFDDFTTGSDATDSVRYTLSYLQYFMIRFLRANDEFLIAGCSEVNFRITGPGGGAISAAQPPDIKVLDTIGSAYVTPANKEDSILFVYKDLRRIGAIEYNNDAQAYSTVDITKAASHMTKGNISQIAFQDGLPDILWAIKEDGNLIALSYDVQEQKIGWHRHFTRGTDTFESVAAFPIDSGFSEIWFIVRRQIDGVNTNLIERLSFNLEFKEEIDFFDGDQDVDELAFQEYLYEQQKQEIHLDCSSSYDGSIQVRNLTLSALTGNAISITASGALFAASDVGREIWVKEIQGRAKITAYTSSTVVTAKVTVPFLSTALFAGDYYFTASTIGELGYLNEETVGIVADGGVHPDQVVQNGTITLNGQYGLVHVGLKYKGLIISNPIEVGGVTKSLHKAWVYLLNTVGIKVGSNIYNLEKIPFRTVKQKMNRPPLLYSGYKDVVFEDSQSREKVIIIEQNSPLPCTVLSIETDLNVSGH